MYPEFYYSLRGWRLAAFILSEIEEMRDLTDPSRPSGSDPIEFRWSLPKRCAERVPEPLKKSS
jgi:hypothetical protein